MANERIKVALSPFYGKDSFVDELTLIKFEKHPRGLAVYSIPTDINLTNIKKAIRLNTLLLVEGNIGDYNEVEEIVIETPKAEEPKAEEPVEEEIKVEEPVEEVKVEEPAAEPAEEEVKLETKATKKSTKKTTKK